MNLPPRLMAEVNRLASFRDDALAPDLRCAIAHRGISRFRVRIFDAPRNDGGRDQVDYARFAIPSMNRSRTASAVRSASAPATPQRGKWPSMFIRAKP